jgi:Putative Actinobacterial Holin-X, holin superfamily III
METATTTSGRARALSTRELIAEILSKASALVQKEVELARTEIKADVNAYLGMARSFAIAAVAALAGLNMLLVALVAALSLYLPAWLAALLVGGLLLLCGGIIAWVAWTRRVTNVLAVTRRTLKDDVEWAKERLA